MKIYVMLLLMFTPLIALGQHVVINEVMAANQTTILDEDGDAPDWIELYNPGSAPVDLTRCGLSDDPADSLKWRFGNTTIPAGGHLVVFASDKNRQTPQLHTNFKISASGETLVLTDSNGVVIDRVAVPVSATDISYARTTDGGPLWGFQTPTPGSANTGGAIGGWADSIAFSHRGGFYPSALSISLAAGDSRIFYTLDGSAPDSTATAYTAPIAIDVHHGPESNEYQGWLPAHASRHPHVLHQRIHNAACHFTLRVSV